MAYTTIDDPTVYFNTVLYTGNGSTQSISGINHKPDLTWIKGRNNTEAPALYDAVRGALFRLLSSGTQTSSSQAGTVTAFGSDGFSIGANAEVNANNILFVSWNWKANGSGSSNTDGTINTTKTSASTASGFSISTYTGTGSAATFGHGLGVAPDAVIVKNLGATEDWNVWIRAETPKIGLLNETAAFYSPGAAGINGATITSDVIGLGTSVTANGSSATYVAYCFAEKQGYSKFGSYSGVATTNGAFVYTGFKPAWVMIKRADSGESWLMMDNKRLGYNPVNEVLLADTNEVEFSNNFDILSNGFKTRTTLGNASGGTYIYMAFAESPFVSSSGIPTTTR